MMCSDYTTPECMEVLASLVQTYVLYRILILSLESSHYVSRIVILWGPDLNISIPTDRILDSVLFIVRIGTSYELITSSVQQKRFFLNYLRTMRHMCGVYK
jgi:hypothetical protein